MSSRRLPLSFVFAIGFSVLSPAAARADLPRPQGWQPSCTIAKMQSAGASCEQCRGYQNPDPCQEELAKKGYARRCEEGGAGSYVAVWCKDKAALDSPDSNKGSSGVAPIPSALPSPAPSAPPSSVPSTSPPPAPSASPPPAPSASPPSSDNRQGTGGCGVGHDASDVYAEGLSALLAVGLGLAILRRRRR